MRLSPPGAAFLDRDGTINVKAPAGEYITHPDQLELLPGAAAAVKALNNAQVPVVVVTNQRGIALGKMTEDDLLAVHARMSTMLRDEAGARVDLLLHCPHQAGACECRKPKPGLLLEAMRRRPDIEPSRSIMVGDSDTDAQAGEAAGVKAYLLGRDGGDLAAIVAETLGRPAR